MGTEEYGFVNQGSSDKSQLINPPSRSEDLSLPIHGNIHTNGQALDNEILADSEIQNEIDNQGIATKSHNVVNNSSSI